MYSVANNQFRSICCILEHYLMSSIEEAFGNSPDFLFQDDNASCHRSKQIKDFLNQNENSPIKSMNWPDSLYWTWLP